MDQSCQGCLGSVDAPSAEPRRAGSSRHAITARKARSHRTGPSAFRSEAVISRRPTSTRYERFTLRGNCDASPKTRPETSEDRTHARRPEEEGAETPRARQRLSRHETGCPVWPRETSPGRSSATAGPSGPTGPASSSVSQGPRNAAERRFRMLDDAPGSGSSLREEGRAMGTSVNSGRAPQRSGAAVTPGWRALDVSRHPRSREGSRYRTPANGHRPRSGQCPATPHGGFRP